MLLHVTLQSELLSTERTEVRCVAGVNGTMLEHVRFESEATTTDFTQVWFRVSVDYRMLLEALIAHENFIADIALMDSKSRCIIMRIRKIHSGAVVF